MSRVRTAKILSVTLLLASLSGCGTGGTDWADEKASLSAHNTPKSWVRIPTIDDPSVSAKVVILRKGQEVSQKNFAEALRNYREGDEIKLVKGVYPFTDAVTVHKSVSQVLISGAGHESVIGFVKNAKGNRYSPEIITHAPLTFRDVQVAGPVISSTTADARIWFEGAFVSGGFTHFGRELMGGTPPEVFIMGGYFSRESSFGKMPPPEYVVAFQPNYLFSVSHTPMLAMRKSHYSIHTLRNTDTTNIAPALNALGKEISKLRAEGGYAMPSEAVMSAALAEIYKITRPDRISIHPNYGSPSMIRTSNNVTLEAFNRLANYLYLKTGSKAEIPLAPQAATALDRAKSATKSGAPTMALLLATQYDIPMFHPRYKEAKAVVRQSLGALQAQHGCKISVNIKGEVGDGFQPLGIIGSLRERTAGLYPVAHIASASENGCKMVTDVYRSVFTHWKSSISTSVSSTLVETDQARAAREAALAANSRDVWKDAFSTVGNAASRAGERSRQVWQNQEKTRTRVEERGSGTYLIYYKGNPNLPPLQVGGGAASSSSASSSAGARAASSGNVPGGMREKKTVRERYYLYGAHEVDYEISITDAGKLATKFERTKHRTASQRGPCEAESVDGWSATLISGDCFVPGLPRSGEIQRAMEDGYVAYLTTNRLPKVAAKVREMYNQSSRLLQAEAALVAAMYGGVPEGKGLAAIKAETEGIYQTPSSGTQIATDLAATLYSAGMM